MPRTSVKTITYTSKRARANKLVKAARATLIAARRTPPSARGFYGPLMRRGPQPELKTIDTLAVAQSFTTAGSVRLLNGVAQGDDITNRQGRRIRMKSILFKLFPSLGAGVTNGDHLRVIVFIDYQANATLAAVTDILDSASALSPTNLSNRARFKIIYDKWKPVAASTYSAGIANGTFTPPQFTFYKKMAEDVTFGGTGNTIGSIQTGALGCLVISNQSSSAILYQLHTRVRFVDP